MNVSALWTAVRERLLAAALRLWFRPQAWGQKLERIGSSYGGWVVPTNLISADWICYCGGAGEDITFDLGLIERFRCHVFSFDPTPRAIEHVRAKTAGEPRYCFYPIGLWSEDTTLRFYAPQNPQHVSHSAVNLQRTAEYFEAPCRRLSSIMRELGHDRIDLLKIDIEGAEYAVLDSMLADRLLVTVLCVEFDQPAPVLKTAGMIRDLIRRGYVALWAAGWNYTFIHRSAISGPASEPGRF